MTQASSAATDIGRKYSTAHRLHHVDGDLRSALEVYLAIIEIHAGAREADYARLQIRRMVDTIVPRDQLLDAHVAMLFGCLDDQV